MAVGQLKQNSGQKRYDHHHMAESPGSGRRLPRAFVLEESETDTFVTASYRQNIQWFSGAWRSGYTLNLCPQLSLKHFSKSLAELLANNTDVALQGHL